MAEEVKCRNCGWKGEISALKPLKRAWERVQPGDVMPAGECPECGSAAMLIDRVISENAHAIGNAEAHLASICEGMKALEQLTDGEAETVEYDGYDYTDEDKLRDALQERPLSVEVRAGWYAPGGDAPEPEEFAILLTTGGPACRIIGRLGVSAECEDTYIEWQDWGTPWVRLPMEAEERKMLERFAGLFYYGE